MKHKFLTPIFALSAALCLCLGLAACSGGTPEGETGADGHFHTAETFRVDDSGHWKVCTICGEKFSAGTHTFDAENACETCGYSDVYTKGLSYQLDEASDTYTLSGIGDDRDRTEVVIPNYYEGKAVTSIGAEAFDGCTPLASVVIPANVTSIGHRAFYGCTSLASLTFGGKSKLTSIGNYAFCHCKLLQKIALPADVSAIGENAFDWCAALTEIDFAGTTADWLKVEKGDSWDNETGNYVITCTDGTIDKSGNVTHSDGQ